MYGCVWWLNDELEVSNIAGRELTEISIFLRLSIKGPFRIINYLL